MRLKCVVYWDEERQPVVLASIPAPGSVPALRAYLERQTGRPVRLISYWNYRRKRYEVLLSMDQILQREALLPSSSTTASSSSSSHSQQQHQRDGSTHSRAHSRTESGPTSPLYRAQLWLETHFLLMEQVDPVEHKEEFRELAQHVRHFAGNKHVAYELTRAARLQYGHLSRMFDRTREECLRARKDDVRLLFYANNAWSTCDAMQFGFLLRESVPRSLEDALHSGPGVGTGGHGLTDLGESTASIPDGATGGNDSAAHASGSRRAASPPVDGGLCTSAGMGEDHPSNTRRHPFTFTSSMVHPKDRKPRIRGPQKLLLCEVAPGRAWSVDEPITSLLAATLAGESTARAPAAGFSPDGQERPPEGYDSLTFEEARSLSASRKATPERQRGRPSFDGKISTAGAAKAAAQCEGRAPLTQVTVGFSHQALPRYLLTIEPVKWDGGGLRGWLGVRRGSRERRHSTGIDDDGADADRRIMGCKQRDTPPSSVTRLVRPSASSPRRTSTVTSPVSARVSPGRMQSLSQSQHQQQQQYTLTSSPVTMPPRQGQRDARREQPALWASYESGATPEHSVRPMFTPARSPSSPQQHGLLYSSRLRNSRRSPSVGGQADGDYTGGNTIDGSGQPSQPLQDTLASPEHSMGRGRPTSGALVSPPSSVVRPQGVDAFTPGRSTERIQQQEQQLLPRQSVSSPYRKMSESGVAPSAMSAGPAGWVSGSSPATRQRTMPPPYRDMEESPMSAQQRSPSQDTVRSLNSCANRNSISNHYKNVSSGGGNDSPFHIRVCNNGARTPGPPSLKPSTIPASASTAASPMTTALTPAHSPVVVPPALRCSTHPLSLRNVYCLDCEELTCAYCASLGHHRGHAVTEAEAHASTLRRKVQALCHDLSQWLDHFTRVERQLETERVETEVQQQRRTHTLRGQIAEVRRVLDIKERALLKQLGDQTEPLRPPLAEAAAVREKYAAALRPLEGCLRAYECGHMAGNEAEGAALAAGRSPRAQLSTLQFVLAAPHLLAEADSFFRGRDRAEEVRLRCAVAAVRAANQRADSLVAAVDMTELRRNVEALGLQINKNVPAGSDASGATTTTRVAGRLMLTDGASAGGQRGRSTSPRRPPRANSPAASRYDEWSTTSPVRETSSLVRGGGGGGGMRRGPPMSVNADGGSFVAESSANLTLIERCLLDLQRGHIWAIQNASKFFCAGQTKAVCSTHFTLKGLTWELRIAPLPRPEEQARGVMLPSTRANGRLGGGQQCGERAGSPAAGASIDVRPVPTEVQLPSTITPGASGGGDGLPTVAAAPPPLAKVPPGAGLEPADEQQWLGIFLFPIGHRQRLDFRIIAFSEVSWTEWKVIGWLDAFAGKGWGLYPFLQRKDLMRLDKLARDNIVKICVTPISDLY